MMEFIVINVCINELFLLKKKKSFSFVCIIDSSEAIQVIAASLFIALACIAICLCKRTQKYKNNRRRRQIQKRKEHR